jgi:hypothetical protein
MGVGCSVNDLSKMLNNVLIIEYFKIDGKVVIVTYHDFIEIDKLLDECAKRKRHSLNAAKVIFNCNYYMLSTIRLG